MLFQDFWSKWAETEVFKVTAKQSLELALDDFFQKKSFFKFLIPRWAKMGPK